MLTAAATEGLARRQSMAETSCHTVRALVGSRRPHRLKKEHFCDIYGVQSTAMATFGVSGGIDI
jgi:hypothetical protein